MTVIMSALPGMFLGCICCIAHITCTPLRESVGFPDSVRNRIPNEPCLHLDRPAPTLRFSTVFEALKMLLLKPVWIRQLDFQSKLTLSASRD